MSPTTPDDDRPSDRRDQLARLFDAPQLPRLVPHLAPELLHQLIRHAGLERCVDIVAAATREQLATILDLDLWGSPVPGADETFDADRFGEWIESLVDHDPATAVGIVSRMDPTLVMTGLSRYLWVVDPGTRTPPVETDDEAWEAPTDRDGTTAELGGYLIEARRLDAWDAIVALLLALSEHDTGHFHAVMQGCRSLSNAGRERDHLDDLLTPTAQALYDVAAARDDRRTAQGFSTAADARAFLALARQPRITTGAASHATGTNTGGNPVAAAFFRDRDTSRRGSAREAGRHESPSEPIPLALSAALEEAVRVLTAAGMMSGGVPGGRRALRGAGPSDPGRHTAPAGLASLLAHLREHQPDTCLRRGQELAFLANALIAGCSVNGRAFVPQEAADAAAATCDLGLQQLQTPPDDDYLVTHDLVSLFEIGWSTLNRDVSMCVAEGLLATLADLPAADSATLHGLRALRRALRTHIAAGTPWRVGHALDVLSTLDTPAWYGLLGLLGECAVLPAIVPAIVERHTGRVDPKAFRFVSTTAQLEIVRRFMTRVPQLLRG